MLQDGRLTFSASMSTPSADDKLDSLLAGSRLRVTGVCVAQKDENGTTSLFASFSMDPTTSSFSSNLPGGRRGMLPTC